MPIKTPSIPSQQGIKVYSITKIKANKEEQSLDAIAVEEPLEIQLSYYQQGKRQKRSLAITMRTPGEDEALALGFLFSENIIGNAADVVRFEQVENTLKVYLAESVLFILEGLERTFVTHASCGICGKPSLDSLEKIPCYFPLTGQPLVEKSILQQLSANLLQEQSLFKHTGGIHAAGLFEADGTLIHFMEDIGRHNALDKLIGYALQENLLPLRQQLLFLSGRISFELVQKASLAGIPIIAAVGAPSSLAIQLASTSGITLIGFVREDRFNIYCGRERVQ